MSWTTTFITFFIIVIVIIAGVFTILAAEDIAANPKYKDDAQLTAAHTYATAASVTIFVFLALLVVLAVVLFIYGEELVALSGSMYWIVLLVNFLLFVLMVVVGVLSLLSLTNLLQSSNFVPGINSRDYNAAQDLSVAGGLALGAAGLVVVIMVFSVYSCPVCEVEKPKIE